MSYNTVANAFRGMDAFNTQQRIRLYEISGETDFAEGYGDIRKAGSALRASYCYGTDTERTQLESILDGTDRLRVGYIGNRGYTERGEGGRIVDLATLGTQDSLNSRLAAAVVLGHEAHRDGITGTAIQQSIETQKAARAHTEMAMRMADRYGIGFINEDSNLLNDVKHYLEGPEAFNNYVAGAYRSDGDFWKLITREDGTHELVDDQNKYLTIEYQDEDGNILGSVIPGGQEAIDNANGMGWAASLANVVGLERASELLGSNLLNTNIYDTQTLKDVLKMSDEEIFHLQTSGTLENLNLTDDQKLSLAGEAMLKSAGASWNGKNWIGTESLSELVTLTNTEVLNGGIVSNYADGKYDYSVVSQDIAVDPRSHFAMANGKHNHQYDGLDSIEITQWDLNNNQLGNPKVFDNFTWTQTMIPEEYSYSNFVDLQYRSAYGTGSVSVGPETIAEGSVAYKLMKWSGFGKNKLQLNYGDTYLQAVSGNLLASGYSIGDDGLAHYNDGRHLIHPANNYANSGCGVTNDKDHFSDYTSYLTGTLGLETGTVLFGDIYQKYDPYLHIYY